MCHNDDRLQEISFASSCSSRKQRCNVTIVRARLTNNRFSFQPFPCSIISFIPADTPADKARSNTLSMVLICCIDQNMLQILQKPHLKVTDY